MEEYNTNPKRAQLLQDLLPYENNMAVNQNDIGLVKDYPFNMELIGGKPRKCKPIRYKPQQRQWIQQEVTNMLSKGIIQQVNEPEFGFPVVLVPQGQSGQEYRFCINYKALNAHLVQPNYVLPCVDEILEQLSNAKYFSSIDLKAGYHNIPITSRCQEYTTFVTQDGSYKFTRMPFGLSTAPGHFQRTVVAILHIRKDLNVVIYLDDICVYGTQIDNVWEQTVECIRRLAGAGFMINIRKSHLLVQELTLLGVRVGYNCFRPNEKKVQLLKQISPPKSYKELSSLHGLLNYFSRWIPQYNEVIQPIKKLLGQKGQIRWTTLQTQALQKIVSLLCSERILAIPDPSKDYTLQIYAGETSLAGVLLQDERPIAFESRDFLKSELDTTLIERTICAAHHCIMRFRQYLAFGNLCTVQSLIPNLNSIFNRDDYQGRIAQKIMDLQQFNLIFKHVQNITALSLTIDNEEIIDMQQDIVFSRQSYKQCKYIKMDPTAYKIYFDGGYKQVEGGGGGFVVLTPDNNEIVRCSRYYNKNVDTNNQAELQCLLNVLEFISNANIADKFTIYGDSLLVINFMNKHWVAKEPKLFQGVARARNIIQEGRLALSFIHIPRCQNQVADMLANEAMKRQQDSTEWLVADFGLSGPECPSVLPGGAALFMEHDEIADKHCETCGVADMEQQVLCDECNTAWHLHCLGLQNVPRGFWFCKLCRRRQLKEGIRDVTQDANLMHYLFEKTFPDDLSPEEKMRLTSAARSYRVYKDKLFRLGGDSYQEVPPICERLTIIDQVHQALGHCVGRKLERAILETYWWPSLRSMINNFTKQCRECVQEQVKFFRPPKLHPCEKPRQPFQGWAIDLITDMKPVGEDGSRHIVVAVDAFSKWVELGVLTDRKASTVASWVCENIIARYGKPHWIRTDQGVEFKREFQYLLRSAGVGHKTISVQHPQANGQVERYNRTIKSSIRKYLSQHPGVVWQDVLPEVLMGLRFCISRSHGMSPFYVLYGFAPELPSTLAAYDSSQNLDISPELEEQRVFELVMLFSEIRELAFSRIIKADQKAEEYYERRTQLESMGIDFILQPGDKVLLKQRRLGKMLPKAVGPYEFVQYHGQTCSLKDDADKIIKAHISHVVPFFG